MKILLILGSLLFITGCALGPKDKILLQERIVVLSPPKALYDCRWIRKDKIPDYENLTDQDIAKYIKYLRRNNYNCKVSQDRVQSWIKKAKEKNSG